MAAERRSWGFRCATFSPLLLSSSLVLRACHLIAGHGIVHLLWLSETRNAMIGRNFSTVREGHGPVQGVPLGRVRMHPHRRSKRRFFLGNVRYRGGAGQFPTCGRVACLGKRRSARKKPKVLVTASFPVTWPASERAAFHETNAPINRFPLGIGCDLLLWRNNGYNVVTYFFHFRAGDANSGKTF